MLLKLCFWFKECSKTCPVINKKIDTNIWVALDSVLVTAKGTHKMWHKAESCHQHHKVDNFTLYSNWKAVVWIHFFINLNSVHLMSLTCFRTFLSSGSEVKNSKMVKVNHREIFLLVNMRQLVSYAPVGNITGKG